MQPNDAHVDSQVMAIVTTAINELGGATRVVRRHEHTILPQLVQSAYALVLREEAQQEPEAIADFLGVSRGAVDSVFQAPTEAWAQRLRGSEDLRSREAPHTEPEWSEQPDTGRLEPEVLAGAVARFAYSIVKRKQGRFPH